MLGVPYTLTLRATYNGANNLTMDFTLSDGNNTTSVSFTDTTPQTGSAFGFRDVVGTFPQSSVALNIHYDNLVITPEPSIVALITTGFAAYAFQRRRTAKHG